MTKPDEPKLDELKRLLRRLEKVEGGAVPPAPAKQPELAPQLGPAVLPKPSSQAEAAPSAPDDGKDRGEDAAPGLSQLRVGRSATETAPAAAEAQPGGASPSVAAAPEKPPAVAAGKTPAATSDRAASPGTIAAPPTPEPVRSTAAPTAPPTPARGVGVATIALAVGLAALVSTVVTILLVTKFLRPPERQPVVAQREIGAQRELGGAPAEPAIARATPSLGGAEATGKADPIAPATSPATMNRSEATDRAGLPGGADPVAAAKGAGAGDDSTPAPAAGEAGSGAAPAAASQTAETAPANAEPLPPAATGTPSPPVTPAPGPETAQIPASIPAEPAPAAMPAEPAPTGEAAVAAETSSPGTRSAAPVAAADSGGEAGAPAAVTPSPESDAVVAAAAPPPDATATPAPVTPRPRRLLSLPESWVVPGGARRPLPFVFEPQDGPQGYRLLVGGLEQDAAITGATEIVAGMWMIDGDRLRDVQLERGAEPPAKLPLTVEVRTAAGMSVGRYDMMLLTSPPGPR